MNKLAIYLLIFSIISCASKSRYEFQSTPSNADVYVKPIKHLKYKKLGSTPLVVDSNALIKSNSGPVYIQFRKSGYKDETILVTEVSSVDLIISRELFRKSGLDDQKSINEVIDLMFEVKNLVQANKYKDALKLVNVLKSMVPQVAAVYELEGGIFFIKKQYYDALGSYRLAARYNPKNPENIRMRDMLEDWFRKEGHVK